MRIRLKTWYQNFLPSFWYRPVLVTLGFILLAVALVSIDIALEIKWSLLSDPGAAQLILSTVASSSITVAALSLSLTLISLTQIGIQLTPRAIRGILRDRVVQMLAGSFIGISAYSFIVLSAVRTSESTHGIFIPVIAITVCIGIAVLMLLLLLLYFHRMGIMVQASEVVGRIGEQTLEAISRISSHHNTSHEKAQQLFPNDEPHFRLHAHKTGYIQLIDPDSILELIEGRATFVRITARPGDLVTPDDTVMEVWLLHGPHGQPGGLDPGLERELYKSITIQHERDMRDDVSYGIRQLTDIGLRALSEGVNDPTTAVTALGWLRSIIRSLVEHDIGLPNLYFTERGSYPRYVLEPYRPLGRYINQCLPEFFDAGHDKPRVIHAIEEIIDKTIHKLEALVSKPDTSHLTDELQYFRHLRQIVHDRLDELDTRQDLFVWDEHRLPA